MTTKDLRDILAYYSDSASCSYWLRSESGTYHKDTWLHEFLYEITNHGVNALNDNVSDFKLQLRPITSLTKDEIAEGEALFEEHKFMDDGRVSIANDTECWNTYITTQDIARAHAYLQSVGVYVPGTIDEKYVQLIP